MTLVEYRYPGQRGSAHQALVPGDVWCEETARANLEAVTGPVATVTIIGIIRRERPDMVESRNQPSLLAIVFADLVPVVLPPIIDMFEINGRAIIRNAPGGPRAARWPRPILPRLAASIPSAASGAAVPRMSARPLFRQRFLDRKAATFRACPSPAPAMPPASQCDGIAAAAIAHRRGRASGFGWQERAGIPVNTSCGETGGERQPAQGRQTVAREHEVGVDTVLQQPFVDHGLQARALGLARIE